MKGEYGDELDEHNNNNTNNMFSKFPQPPKFQPHFPHQSHHFHNHNLVKDPQPSEEADSTTATTAATTTPPSTKKPKTTTNATASEDGGTIEVSRRPRGRPPGSKNKPKPPIVITREPEPAMAPYILEIPGGSDIVDSLTRFTRRRGIGICVLTASGAVANVTLKQPSTSAPGGTVTFHGRFDILSLSAVLLHTVPFSGNGGFTISLAGPQGQIVGGKVVGPLVSAGTVYVIAASFNSPSYHRLPLDDQQDAQTPAAGGGGGGGDGQSSSQVSGGGDGGGDSGGAGGGTGTGTMALYSCHLGSSSSDVIWAPTARPPPPPY